MHDTISLEKAANQVRQTLIKMLVGTGSGHSAGPLGMADIFTALYGYLLHHHPQDPTWEDRDRLLVSNGHICPLWYATLAHFGYFDQRELLTLRQINSRLQGHPHWKMTRDQSPAPNEKQSQQDFDELKFNHPNTKYQILNTNLPGIENTSGPLGQGVSQAVGLALAAAMDGKTWRTICITSDGEQEEGQVWESYLLASKYRLGKLTFILDRNQIQIDGHTHDIMPSLEPLKAKLEAFGLFVLEIDGHNFDEIVDAYHKGLTIQDRPTLILAHTIPGKDVEFMENLPQWHGKTPNVGETIEALRELRSFGGADSHGVTW